ncbi:MAG: hypothetical protein B6U95_00335 [Thermofilum sp. ex4484_82]|nr:MAG: hypothetical protein B6U95_00335 [Thermofilum sp. ex4484_82]OYT40063.1 MAG: hypothetical protein B6U96_00340 [Archaeoglobales archaeon ex4484_92]
MTGSTTPLVVISDPKGVLEDFFKKNFKVTFYEDWRCIIPLNGSSIMAHYLRSSSSVTASSSKTSFLVLHFYAKEAIKTLLELLEKNPYLSTFILAIVMPERKEDKKLESFLKKLFLLNGIFGVPVKVFPLREGSHIEVKKILKYAHKMSRRPHRIKDEKIQQVRTFAEKYLSTLNIPLSYLKELLLKGLAIKAIFLLWLSKRNFLAILLTILFLSLSGTLTRYLALYLCTSFFEFQPFFSEIIAVSLSIVVSLFTVYIISVMVQRKKIIMQVD